MDLLKNAETFLTQMGKNPYVVAVIGIIAIVYGGLLAPNLPASVAQLFANPVFKVGAIALILAVKHIQPSLAILLAIGLVISVQTLNRYQIFSTTQAVSNQLESSSASVGRPVTTSDASLVGEAQRYLNARQQTFPTPMGQQAPLDNPMSTSLPAEPIYGQLAGYTGEQLYAKI